MHVEITVATRGKTLRTSVLPFVCILVITAGGGAAAAAGVKLGDVHGVKLGDVDGVKLGDVDGVKLGDIDGVKLGDVDGVKLGDVDGVKLGDVDGAGLRLLIQTGEYLRLILPVVCSLNCTIKLAREVLSRMQPFGCVALLNLAY